VTQRGICEKSTAYKTTAQWSGILAAQFNYLWRFTMSDREKFRTLINGKQQIADGSVDELLLTDDLRNKIAMIEQLEKRLAQLEQNLGDIKNFDPLAVYNTAKASVKT
jgi:hypothetical protein